MSKPTQARVVHCTRQRYDVYIGRGTPFGNPYVIGVHGNRKQVIELYRSWFAAQPKLQQLAREQLTGKRLGCWCRPLPCHGDILAAFVNSESRA